MKQLCLSDGAGPAGAAAQVPDPELRLTTLLVAHRMRYYLVTNELSGGAVANWSALHSYIESNYTVAKSDADIIQLVFQLDDNRSQLVLVARGGEVEGSEWAVISSAVCGEGEISPRDALVRNNEMLVGGLALVEGGPVIFRYAIRLADLDPAEFEAPIKIAAIFGDELEQELSGADRF